MKRIVLTLFFLSTALAATPASGGVPVNPQCCACLVDGPPDLPALFCADLITLEPEKMAFEAQCADLHGIPQCLEFVPGAQSPTAEEVNCPAVLGGLPNDAIVCPGLASTAPAPVLGTAVLAGLAVALAGLGVRTVRRRGSTYPPR